MKDIYVTDALFAITNNRRMNKRFWEILHPTKEEEIDAEAIIKKVKEGLK